MVHGASVDDPHNRASGTGVLNVLVSETHVKRPMPPNDLLCDAPRRNALLAFLKRSLPEKMEDGRVGLIVAQSFLEGYQCGLKRGRRP